LCARGPARRTSDRHTAGLRSHPMPSPRHLFVSAPALGCAVLWGVVELLALWRARAAAALRRR